MSSDPSNPCCRDMRLSAVPRWTGRCWCGWAATILPTSSPQGHHAWQVGQLLQPDDVRFDAFRHDYETLYRVHREAEDDFFYIGSAYWGIPLEAILGCAVHAGETSCWAEMCSADPHASSRDRQSPDRPSGRGEACLALAERRSQGRPPDADLRGQCLVSAPSYGSRKTCCSSRPGGFRSVAAVTAGSR